MIEAHTADAWTNAAGKNTALYGYLTVLGGFAAPLFLWLAGLGVVLSATRSAERTGSRAAAVDAICRRGLEIYLLAFLFRLQAFIVSPGNPAVMLFRVDILNIMGPAMVAAGLLWPLTDRTDTRIAVYGGVAAAVALATPIVRAAATVGALPLWIQWYLRPAGDFTTFTMFPWSGFVFAGAATGTLVAAVRDRQVERRMHLALAVAGAFLVAAGLYASTRTTIYAVPSYFWTSSPTWFSVRVGLLMLAFAAVGLLMPASEDVAGRRSPVVTLGRASLFVYWIHVELVCGYASWFWRGSLPVWSVLPAYAAFTLLMYAVVLGRNHYLERAVRNPRAAALSRA
jgi:uncharacterized membrane protein